MAWPNDLDDPRKVAGARQLSVVLHPDHDHALSVAEGGLVVAWLLGEHDPVVATWQSTGHSWLGAPAFHPGGEVFAIPCIREPIELRSWPDLGLIKALDFAEPVNELAWAP